MGKIFNASNFHKNFTSDDIYDVVYTDKPHDIHIHKQEMGGNNHEGIHLKLGNWHSQKLKL